MMNEGITLSNREEQVLKLLLEGHLHKQIGAKLGISESRVNDVKSIIKKKWGVQTDVDFFLAALKRGYLRTEVDFMGGLPHYVSNPTISFNIKYFYAQS